VWEGATEGATDGSQSATVLSNAVPSVVRVLPTPVGPLQWRQTGVARLPAKAFAPMVSTVSGMVISAIQISANADAGMVTTLAPKVMEV
jgi:hypothetical protein